MAREGNAVVGISTCSFNCIKCRSGVVARIVSSLVCFVWRLPKLFCQKFSYGQDLSCERHTKGISVPAGISFSATL